MCSRVDQLLLAVDPRRVSGLLRFQYPGRLCFARRYRPVQTHLSAVPGDAEEGTVDKLRRYVEQGGALVSEGLPRLLRRSWPGRATQPNYGLDQLFGARESYVEFTPDLLDKLSLEVRGHEVDGRYFLQEYELAGGQAAGRYGNGHVAAVVRRLGKGRTLLIGTFSGGGYYLHHSTGSRSFFSGLLKMADAEPRLRTDNPAVQARLHTGRSGSYLWVVNPARDASKVTVRLQASDGFRTAEDVTWEHLPVTAGEHSVTVTVPRHAMPR